MPELFSGKRIEEKLVCRGVSPDEPKPALLQKNKIILDFIISHAPEDKRPYLEVSILGKTITGLLDTGASRTIVGNTGYEILSRLGLKLTPHVIDCTVANGEKCPSIGYVKTPIYLKDRMKWIDILVVPGLSHELILGIDFWLKMEIVPNLNEDIWHFSDVAPTSNVCLVQDKSSLSSEQAQRLDRLLNEKFKIMGSELGCTRLVEHVIEVLPETRPIKQRWYPVSPLKQKIIDDHLDQMLKDGVVEPSKSPWSSPVCLVSKKDGSYRFCVDYRQLNAVTKKDAYPIPYISSILDRLRDAKYLSSLDIKSAFFQIPLSEDSKEYTAFTVPGRGLFQFKRLAFGLTNSPATFQRAIDTILGPELEPFVFKYIDDIIIVSKDFESHLMVLSLVFDRLVSAGLVVSREKCKFCMPQLKYLGYVVDSYGIRPDTEKVEAILNIPPPKNTTEVRRFIGTASWYRRFVPNFSSILSPLSNLTKKNVTWNWTDECEASFQHLKECLSTAPVLNCPDFTRQFIVQTDASAYGIGAVLSQEFEDGEHVIAYLSRSLTRQERNYSTTERECLAVIWAVEKLRYYLEGTFFRVITDHHSLLWLNNLRDPQGRLARWSLRLMAFTFELVHRKGKDNVVPDMLSRSMDPSLDSVQLSSFHQKFTESEDLWYKRMIEKVKKLPEKFSAWRVEKQLLYKYTPCRIPELSSEADYWKLVVPKNARKDLIRQCHDDLTSGHLGIFKTLWRLKLKYYWPKMLADVVRYVNGCSVCQACKPEHKAPAGLMGSRPDIKRPWQMISLDFVGPLPASSNGYKYLLVVTDYFSKYVLLSPLRAATSKSLSRFIEECVFLVYGVPQIIICDNGTPMRGSDFVSMVQKYGCRLQYTPYYHPCADPTERSNQTIKTMIRCYLKDNHRKWAEKIAALACALRTARSEVTGYTPHFVNFGREICLSGKDYETNASSETTDENLRKIGFQKLFLDVQNRLRKAQDRYRHTYNLRRRPLALNEGDKIMLKNKCLSDAAAHFSAKLAPKYVGPFNIGKKLGKWTYEVVDDSQKSKGVWHVSDMKPCVPCEDHG